MQSSRSASTRTHPADAIRTNTCFCGPNRPGRMPRVPKSATAAVAQACLSLSTPPRYIATQSHELPTVSGTHRWQRGASRNVVIHPNGSSIVSNQRTLGRVGVA